MFIYLFIFWGRGGYTNKKFPKWFPNLSVTCDECGNVLVYTHPLFHLHYPLRSIYIPSWLSAAKTLATSDSKKEETQHAKLPSFSCVQKQRIPKTVKKKSDFADLPSQSKNNLHNRVSGEERRRKKNIEDERKTKEL